MSRLPTVALMHADEVARPFHHDGWVYEEKYDGWRMAAHKDGTAVRLVSRAGKEHSRRFADLAAAIRALPLATLILDGEVAIFDEKRRAGQVSAFTVANHRDAEEAGVAAACP
jgi:bifunctional non-homologous end joining protein LigD